MQSHYTSSVTPGMSNTPRSIKRNEAKASPRKIAPLANTAAEKPGDLPSPQAEIDGVVIIAATGDIVIDAEAEDGGEMVSLRVDSKALKNASPYFERLLDPKYQEGVSIARQYDELRQLYPTSMDVAVAKLPHVKISYLGQTSVRTIRPLMTDFMNILHGNDSRMRKLPLVNLANLAVIADRFDACSTVARWANRKGLFGSQTVVKAASTATLSEESVRQRMLVGMLLQHGPWLSTASAQLIMNGSIMWSDGDHNTTPPDNALWWDIPGHLEDELQFRRLALLSTLDSLVTHHLTLFTSKTKTRQQCRLGYDTSPQCDSFQLGEFVKFLTRHGLFHLRSTFTAPTPSYPSNDFLEFSDDNDRNSNNTDPRLPTDQPSVPAILKTLRQCPSYQLDPHHTHCGPRNNLLQCLDLLQRQHLGDVALGVCVRCWVDVDPAAEQVWSRAKRPLRWDGQVHAAGAGVGSKGGGAGAGSGHGVEWCRARGLHDAAREVLLAVDRDWAAVGRWQ